ncbi:hypothetical protein [Litchfieldia salsa]|uniref:Uncharacterized protein n=1 Tax=Litchfieldia salsa TaxID=930152 RepID=A0A1H0X1G5_9BACI|nr:hypothetical protein [Litchfieldia salsa]SDP96585.1 hypothetical protein SAMN05216565_1228 [Litchfieldia salsa]
MNKIFVVWIIICAFLIGCSSIIETEPTPVHPLFSADKNKYSLLMLGETEMEDYHKWLGENGISNVETIHGRTSLEKINEEYKFLELEKSPAYAVFDTKDVVFKSYSEKALIEFLRENNPNR